MVAPATGVPATRTPRITECPRIPPSRIAAPHRRGRAGQGVRAAPVAPGRGKVRPAGVRPPAAAQAGERRAEASPARPAAATGDRPRAAAPGAQQDGAGRAGPAPEPAAGRYQQRTKWRSGTVAGLRQERRSDGSPPHGRRAHRRTQVGTGPAPAPQAGRCPEVGRPTVGRPALGILAIRRRRIGPATQDEHLPRRRRTRQARDGPARRQRDRRAPAAAPQGRRVGQRRPARRPPGQPA